MKVFIGSLMLMLASARIASPELHGVYTNDTIPNLLASLREYAETSSDQKKERAVEFDIPEQVINLYLEHAAGKRPGVKSASVALLGDGTIKLRVVADAERLRDWAPKLFAKPLAMPGLTLNAILQTECRNRSVGVSLLSVREESGRMRPAAAAEAIRIMALHQPEAVDIGKPVALPYGLERVYVTQGMLHGTTR